MVERGARDSCWRGCCRGIGGSLLALILIAAGGRRLRADSGASTTPLAAKPDGASASSASPQKFVLGTPSLVNESRLNFGFQVAYALQAPVPPNGSHINLFYAQPQLGVVLHDFRSSPVSRLELLNEGMLGGSVHPGGRILGYALLLRLEGTPHHNTAPLLDWGAGALNTTINQHAYELAGGLQFAPQAGIGFEHRFNSRRAFIFEYRFLHMSNAGIREPNHGFNASMLTIGFRWMRRPGAAALR